MSIGLKAADQDAAGRFPFVLFLFFGRTLTPHKVGNESSTLILCRASPKGGPTSQCTVLLFADQLCLRWTLHSAIAWRHCLASRTERKTTKKEKKGAINLHPK